MEVFELSKYRAERPCVVALGNFDGVHRGHRTLLKKAVEMAGGELRPTGALSLTYTFIEHPVNVLAGAVVLPSLTTNEEKIELLSETGMAVTVLDHFDRELASKAPEEFFKEIIVKKLGAVGVVCGFHYHFGSRGAGDAALLEELCGEAGIALAVLPPYKIDGRVVSSTWIRECVESGRADEAERLMGHCFFLYAPVVHGNKIGRTMGSPTVNQVFDPYKIVPESGVYVTEVTVGAKRHRGVTNVGVRPTVGGSETVAETHIIGFDGELYGEKIKVDFMIKIRDEIHFKDLSELRAQIGRDIDRAKRFVRRA